MVKTEKVKVMCGEAPDGRWIVQLTGPAFGCIILDTPKTARDFADDFELHNPAGAQISATIRKMATRCEMRGIEA